MTQSFYERLGIDVTASRGQLRQAYVRAVTLLQRRRGATEAQGGDTSVLDQHRSRVDEAWGVLSDPVKRRCYDAMLLLEGDAWPEGGEQLWDKAAGAFVLPGADVAVELLGSITSLAVGQMPRDPSSALAWRSNEASVEDEQTVTYTSTRPTVVPLENSRERGGLRPVDGPGFGVPQGAQSTAGGGPSLHVVDGSPSSASVLLMAEEESARSAGSPSPRSTELTSEDVARLISLHGYSGRLLREARVARGLTLEDLSRGSRISERYLEAVEADAYDRLPSSTFVRGYVREMARQLALEPDAVVTGYMKRLSGEG